MVPIFLPAAGIRLYLSSLKGTVHKIEIMHIAIVEVGWQTFQEFLCGIGKVVLKKLSRSVSVLKCHFASLPNDQEGISVMEFWSPAM